MAIFDFSTRSIVLKIVYYGCALSGKTTNLVTLHRLTDPDGRQGLVSIATKNDRTLFFDLLPFDLGQVGGLTVRVKIYTVPGQVHYEVTRRQVLSGADGVVLVADSGPDMIKANLWAMENLKQNLRRLGLDPATTPITLQWNKRDLADAVEVQRLAETCNKEGLPAFEAVATKGTGVIETFASVIKRSIAHAYEKSGKKGLVREELDHTVDAALDGYLAKGATSRPAAPTGNAQDTSEPSFDHRFDYESYRDEWADKGRDRHVVDEETLLSEAVQTSMELAERLDGVRDIEEAGEHRRSMLEALAELQSTLQAPSGPALPHGLMATLIRASQRSRGSLLLFQAGKNVMQEREVLPSGRDPLNLDAASSIGSAAFRLSQGDTPRVVSDLRTEIFFDAVPAEAEGLLGAVLVPIVCDGTSFGSLIIYGTERERPFGPAELAFWTAAGRALALSLHWRALRRKLAPQTTAPGTTR